MKIGRVVGCTWATQRHDSLKPLRMLLVKEYDPIRDEFSGVPYMCLDKNINAGMGDRVLMVDDGGPSRMILDDDMAPVRGFVVGIVDDIHINSAYQEELSGS